MAIYVLMEGGTDERDVDVVLEGPMGAVLADLHHEWFTVRPADDAPGASVFPVFAVWLTLNRPGWTILEHSRYDQEDRTDLGIHGNAYAVDEWGNRPMERKKCPKAYTGYTYNFYTGHASIKRRTPEGKPFWLCRECGKTWDVQIP